VTKTHAVIASSDVQFSFSSASVASVSMESVASVETVNNHHWRHWCLAPLVFQSLLTPHLPEAESSKAFSRTHLL
jgi:hypothetical protein